ncbi:hypothetical protein ABL78_6191 [Leptomonas seymouri]|uniref:Rab-GAP TBC domain-containing protein n=1 Tax=Leptomonas seymouri TaxID=5684 RepID=A0A0N0P406_LEPSE|nr:hypothetical protein ABL78_6191 [Leptomonas seymouri]|eukprot:KPI84746.1 hypothetical protein ABL78_6191 [Leptomonas seymouri]
MACSASDPAADAALAEEVERRRLHQTEEEYADYCVLLCRTGQLRTGKLRAKVWRDVVIGRKEAKPVPLLGDCIVQQFLEETRSQAAAAADTHSRETTKMEESLNSAAGRETPLMADASGGPDSTGNTHENGDASVSAPLLTPRSEGRGSDSDVAFSSPNNAAGPSSSAPPTSPNSRRFRHRSLELEMLPCSSPLNATEESQTSLKTHAPIRRRAMSQCLYRVKSDANPYNDLWRGNDQSGSASSSNELSGSILRPMAWYHLPENCQPRIVEADVERSLWKLYPIPEERTERRRCLKSTILRVLLHNTDRFYYQGLHELMGFVMYMLSPYLDAEEVLSVCEVLLNTRWRKFSARRLTNSEAMLYAVHAVIAQEDPPLAAVLEWCGVGPESHYAVPWVITWYVHNVESIATLARLFDYFIADPTGTAVIHFTAAFVLSQRKSIFECIQTAKDEIGVDTDAPEATENGIVLMARVYTQLSRLPGSVLQSMDADSLEGLISQAEFFASLHSEMVQREEENFLGGDVKKLGMLSNATTRNAALRLLWHFLPREWRSPAKVEYVRRLVFWTSVMVAATAVVFGTAAVDAKQGGWVRNLFH